MNRIWIILGFMSSIVNSEHRFPYTRQTAITVGLCCVFAVYSVFCIIDTRIKQANSCKQATCVITAASKDGTQRPPPKSESPTKPTKSKTQKPKMPPPVPMMNPHPIRPCRPDPTQPKPPRKSPHLTPSITHPLSREGKKRIKIKKRERDTPLTQYSTL